MNTNNLEGPDHSKASCLSCYGGEQKHTNTPVYTLCRGSFPKEFPLRKGWHPTKRKQKGHLSCAAPSKAYWISTQFFFPLLVENMFPICLTNEPWGPALPFPIAGQYPDRRRGPDGKRNGPQTWWPECCCFDTIQFHSHLTFFFAPHWVSFFFLAFAGWTCVESTGRKMKTGC